MKRRIHKVAVIGSGVMGSAIACHFANIGVQVILLDITPHKLTEKETQKGLSLKDKSVRNRIVNSALKKALSSKPAPLYHKKFADRIQTGNLEDDIAKISEADWVLEVVTEKLEIKQKVFDQIEEHRSQGSLVSSNTSGIPIHLMSKDRSEDFQKHFCITHFFNPPRYLRLLEIIPGPNTTAETLSFLNSYGEKFLGKQTVIAKDTPAFIGNRIGVFSIMSLFHQLKTAKITIEEIDKLTGPVIGRPKSATFRTADLVGLDTLVEVAKGLYKNAPEDEQRDLFALPDFIKSMVDQKLLGAKTNHQGFYKKIKHSNNPSEIKTLDLDTMEYREQKKASFPLLEKTKSIGLLSDRYPLLLQNKGHAGDFYRQHFAGIFAYSAHRIPEISDTFYKIDDAMRAGFGWEHGPFQVWNAIGVKKGITLIKEQGYKSPGWVTEMLDNGVKNFYSVKEGQTYYYDIKEKKQLKVPGQEAFIVLNNIRKPREIFTNDDLVVEDLGEGILNVEFRSKMNIIGGDVLDGLNKALDLAEKEYDGLVIYNEGKNFSAGANIGLILMMAAEQEFDELDQAVRYFQKTSMRMRYSAIPTVSAPHALTIGGGCEISLHADKVIASAETYMGLVEAGVGLIPGGGGSKEMALRAADSFQKGDVELNRLQQHLLTIGTAQVSTSAEEAFDQDMLQSGKDSVVINQDRQLALAKKHALLMTQNGYTRPVPRKDIKVLGKQSLGALLVGTNQMFAGNYISAHDQKIANKLAYIMSGGDLSENQQVSEQYLLDLEREAFLSLCGEKKTLERLQHMLKKGKPLRN